MTLACASITSNGVYGLQVTTVGTLTLKGVISSGNGTNDLNYAGVPILVRNLPVKVND